MQTITVRFEKDGIVKALVKLATQDFYTDSYETEPVSTANIPEYIEVTLKKV